MGDNKCFILLSGGQDSATALAIAKSEGKEIYALTFDYGQSNKVELQYSRNLGELAGVKDHLFVDISSVFPALGSVSSLFDSSLPMLDKHPLNDKVPASFVPGRNYFFLGFAAVIAYNHRIKEVYAGMNAETVLPDVKAPTIAAIEEALRLSLDYDLKINTPLKTFYKKDIIDKIVELGHFDWYGSTITCYNGQRPPCGACASCKTRAKGFKDAGMGDPLFDYKHEGVKLL